VGGARGDSVCRVAQAVNVTKDLHVTDSRKRPGLVSLFPSRPASYQFRSPKRSVILLNTYLYVIILISYKERAVCNVNAPCSQPRSNGIGARRANVLCRYPMLQSSAQNLLQTRARPRPLYTGVGSLNNPYMAALSRLCWLVAVSVHALQHWTLLRQVGSARG